MKYFYFQIKFRAGDNHRFWEDHVAQHDQANDEEVRRRLAFKHIQDSFAEVQPEDEDGFIQINGGEVAARITKTAELTEKEYNILKRYIQ